LEPTAALNTWTIAPTVRSLRGRSGAMWFGILRIILGVLFVS